MSRNTLLANSIVTTLTALFVAAPGTNLTFFDGLPLSSTESLTTIIWLILLWTVPWQKNITLKTFALSSVVILLALQPIGAKFIPSGWSVCLRREVAVGQLTTPCEPSAQYRRGQPTFVLKDISFRLRTFPLHFMNNMKYFNFHESNEPDQKHLPYSLEATAFFHPSTSTPLTLSTSINTELTLNNRLILVPANQATTITLPASQTTRLDLAYSSSLMDNQHFIVTTDAVPFVTSNIPSTLVSASYRLLFSTLLLFASLPIFVAAAYYFFSLTKKSQYLLVFSVLFLTLWWLTKTSPYLILTLFTVFISWHVFSQTARQRRLLLPFLLILLLLASHRFVSVNTPYPQMGMGSIGRDTWAHLSVARNQYITQSWSEFIGTNPFYYQPLHSYLAAAILKTMDESLWSLYLVQSSLAALAVALTIRLMITYSTKSTAFIFTLCLIALSGFGLVTNPWLSPFYITTTTYQHGLATPLVILASLCLVELLLKDPLRPWLHLAAGLLIGATLMTRMDYIPLLGIVLIYGLVFLWRRKLHRQAIFSLILLAVGLSVFPSLVITKNYLATGAVILSPTSTTMNAYGGFYHIIPYASKPITSTQMITKVISWYHHHGRYYDLMMALTSNLKDNFITPMFQHQLLWYISPIIAFFALLQGRRTERLIIFVFLTAFLSVVLPNLFFRIHPASFDMHIIFDYWLIVLASFGLSILWRQRTIFRLSSTAPSNTATTNIPESNKPSD